MEISLFFILKVSGGLLGAFAFFKVVSFVGNYQEKRFRRERDSAEREYREALRLYFENKESGPAKERCYRKGDIYFSYKVPDYFQYPFLDSDYNADFVDNRALREEMVRDDINEELGKEKSA